jgi:hypothetical protein
MATSLSCSQRGLGPLRTPRTRRPTKYGQVEAHGERAREAAGHRLDATRPERADALGREVARDAAHAEAVLAVRRDGDVDDRVVEAEHPGEGLAHRRVRWQVDDAVMLVGQAHLARRAEHAVGGLAADRAGLQLQPGAGDGEAGAGEDALHAGARVGRAADDLHLLLAGVDDADAQAIRVGMLARLDHVADDEGRELRAAIVHRFELEPDRGDGVADLREAGGGVEMLPEPGQRELHRASPPVIDGTSSGMKP